jgi:hypothetical protein
VAEPVHSRINELMSLHAFMKDAEIESGSKTAETIMEMWTEGNMPYTKQYSKGSRMFKGQIGRPFFSRSKDFPVSSDTLHIKEGSLYDWLAEYAHQMQYNKPMSVRDSLSTAGGKQFKKYGERPGVYGYRERVPVEGREGFFTEEKYFPSALMELDPQLGWTESTQDTLSPTSRINYEKYDPSKNQDLSVEFEAHRVLQDLLWNRIGPSIAEDMKKKKKNNGKP